MLRTGLATDRWGATQEKVVAGPPPVEINVVPKSAIVPPDLRQVLLKGVNGESAFCPDGGSCRVYPQPDATFVVFMDGCANLPAAHRNDPSVRCTRQPGVFERRNGKWANIYEVGAVETVAGPARTTDVASSLKRESDALDQGDVRIVPVEKRQLVIGGKPTGSVF